MIAANELRIGNLVFFEDDWFKGKYAEIICIQSHCVLIKDFRGTPKIEEINPIPLTPEILEKCGFKRDTVYFYRYSIGSFNIHKTLKDFKKADTKENRCFRLALDLGEFLKTEIQYLHQLQNLYFALTGEELNINL